MGEIFSRPKPPADLAFTGERLTSALGGQTEIEHLHRYMIARQFCRGQNVLDIASGEGYGSVLLSQVATSVTGVDVAADAICHANASYGKPGLRFVQGSAHSIPIENATVDAVVSFETIEHFNGQDQFLAEVRRVLKPGGLFIVSTPDRDNYSPAEYAANPYHSLELTRDEFVALLKRHFKYVGVWWQRAMIGSAMFPSPETVISQETICFERRGADHFEGSTGYARPQYLIAFCSDSEISPLPASVYIDTGALNAREDQLKSLIAAETERAARTEALDDKYRADREAAAVSLRIAEARAAAAEAAARAAETSCRELQGMIGAARMAAETEKKAAEQLRQVVAGRDSQIAALLRSTSWRATKPLRAIRGLLSVGSP